jgi:hypothetical protein
MSAIGAGNSSPRCSRFLLFRVPNYPDARRGSLLLPTSEKIIGITRFWTILSGVASTTDILRLLIAEATHERSNRSSSSIRIFSKASALNEFDSR